MLNDRVQDIRVDIEWVRTKTLSSFSQNRYWDPSDHSEWDPGEMTSLDKGHVYQFRLNGGDVLVHTPYRVVDNESGRMLRTLKSFWALDPTILPSASESSRRNPSIALQDFRLSHADFQSFRGYGRSRDWVFEPFAVNVEVLLRDMRDAERWVSVDYPTLLDTFRATWTVPPGPRNAAELVEATNLMRAGAALLSSARARQIEFATQLDRLSREDRRAEFIQAEALNEQFNNALRAAGSLPAERYDREATHLYRVATGAESTGTTGHLRPLAQELDELRTYYPALRNLRADGKDLLVGIDGLIIRFTPSAIMVEGDPAVLRPYLGASTSDSAPVVSNRFRAVVSQDPTDKP